MNVPLQRLLFWEKSIQFWEDERSKTQLKQHFRRLLKWHGFLMHLAKSTRYGNPSKFPSNAI